jgi:hypothetical protein
MTGYLIMFGGMFAFAAFFVIIDFLNERRARRSHNARP